MDYTASAARLVQPDSEVTIVSAEFTGAPGSIAPFTSLDFGIANGQPITLGSGLLLTTGSAAIASHSHGRGIQRHDT
jgi:hypothetical protein